jgi:hypothetical protein
MELLVVSRWVAAAPPHPVGLFPATFLEPSETPQSRKTTYWPSSDNLLLFPFLPNVNGEIGSDYDRCAANWYVVHLLMVCTSFLTSSIRRPY